MSRAAWPAGTRERHAFVRGLAVAAMTLAVLAATAGPAGAQGREVTPPPLPGARIIVGVVVDTLGRPVNGATVYIDNRKRQVVAGEDGTFRFGAVDGVTTDAAVRGIGYYPQTKTIQISGDGASVVFTLVPRVTQLRTVVMRAARTGISGVISDLDLLPIAGAEITAMGSTWKIVKTDSLGRFYADVKAGSYMVRVAMKDFLTQQVSVTIPPDSGREIALRLERGRNPRAARDAFAADAMRFRLSWRSTVWSKVYTREDIAKMHISDPVTIAKVGAIGPVDDDCNVIVNGGPNSVPLWSIDPSEIELFEVYSRSVTVNRSAVGTRGITSMGGGRAMRNGGGAITVTTSPPRLPGQRCPASMYVWTSR
jgi:hypothetical protein